MPGQRGLNRNLGRLPVADFADHHHIGVLTQNGAQARGEGQPHLGIDLGLADALHRIFHRILDRQDVAAAIVQQAKRSVERGRLARSGRPGDENDPVRLGDRLTDHLVDRRRHAELFEVDPGIVLVENAQHHALARTARQRRDTHVEQFAAQRQADAAVLRHAALGDVEARHHLHAADHHRRHVRRHAQRLAQNAIDPHADDEPGFIRLDMDVRHAVARGIGDDAVDQADRRRVIGRIQQILRRRQVARQQIEIAVQAQIARGHRRRLPVHRVNFAEQLVERLCADERYVEWPAQVAAKLDQHLGVAALAHRDRRVVRIAVDHHAEAPREWIGNGCDGKSRRWRQGRRDVGGRRIRRRRQIAARDLH